MFRRHPTSPSCRPGPTGGSRTRRGTLRGTLLRCLTLACAAWLATLAAADEHEDLPPTHSLEPLLYATGFEFAEAPALDPQGNLFAANYRFLGTIGRIAVDGTAAIWCDLRRLAPLEGRQVQAGGMKVDAEGRLIVADAGGGRLLRVATSGQQVEVLADRFEGSRFLSVSDVALDLKGNIYFTDAGALIAEADDKLAGSVYRYDIQTKKTTRLASGLACPNGLAVSPDQMYLSVAESQRFRILLFDVNTKAGTLLNQRVLIAFPYETHGDVVTGQFVPDGMVFDARGRLYVAMWYGGVINVIDVPSGKLLRQYDAGGSQATNCHFSGAYLYVSVAAKEAVFRLKIDVPGHEYVTRTTMPSP